MARAREAFAGVRSATLPGGEPQSDLTCCAYGRSCSILRDNALAALVESDQHLQTWTGDKDVTVDRYDVRLLLHDARQLGSAGKHTTGTSDTEDEEELDFERFRDLYPAQAAVAAPEAESQPDAGFAPGAHHTAAVSHGEPEQYSAVAFDYSCTEAVAPVEQAVSAHVAPVIPDVPFVAQFAAPDSIKGHLPSTERMHKIILQTAKYVRHSGGQTEFVLRVKQANNPNFEFLDPSSLHHAYFRWLVSTKPEEMLIIDAAPMASVEEKQAGSPEGDTSPRQAVSSVDDSAQALAVSGPQPEPDQAAGSADQSTETSQVAQPSQAAPSDNNTAGQAQQAAAASFTSAAAPAVTQAEAQRPALPVADMAALAQRIGKASAVTVSQAASTQQAVATQPAATLQPQNAANDGAASAVAGGIMVPAELQAIIHKLVAFIKKAGPRFEATVRAKEKANPKFAFLLPWNQYHWYYKQQLVSQLGKATADEVFALRANAPASAPAEVPSAPAVVLPATAQHSARTTTEQPSGAASSPQLSAPPIAGQAEDKAQATPAIAPAQDSASHQLDAPGTAAQNHQEAQPTATEQDASAVKGSQNRVSNEGPVSQQPLTTAASAEAKHADDGFRSEDLTFKPSIGSLHRAGSAQGKFSGRPAVASVPNNPRFAPRPVLQSNAEVQTQKGAFQSSDGDVKGHFLSSTKDEGVSEADQPHAAHAAPGSLEAVMEAQNALLTERQQQPQLAVSQEELQIQRRKLVRQMLEAKQKAAAETEEQRRQKQQSALAKYRQAFASDTEEEVIHMVVEDDPEHEPLEPGEWVEQPEEKAAPAPVLTVAQRGALPSLEDLIQPRQDLIPHQRVFPLPHPAGPDQQRHDRAEVAPASPSTSGRSHTSDSQTDTRRRHRRKRRRSRRRSASNSSSPDRSDSDRKHKKQKRKHKASKRKFKEAFKEAFKKAAKARKSGKRHKSKRSRSHSSTSSESSGRGHKRRSRSPNDSEDDKTAGTAAAASSSANALRAKVRAMLGSL